MVATMLEMRDDGMSDIREEESATKRWVQEWRKERALELMSMGQAGSN